MKLLRSRCRVPMVVATLSTATVLLAACGGETASGSDARAAAAASPSTAAAAAEEAPSASPAPDSAMFGRSTRVCIVNSTTRELELWWEEPGRSPLTIKPRQTNCQYSWIPMGMDIQVFVRHSRPGFFVLAEADNPSIGKPQAVLNTVRERPGWDVKTSYELAQCLNHRYDVGDRWTWDSGLFEVTITRLPDTKDYVEFTYYFLDSPQPLSQGESRNCTG
jgi:hypothetical protein